MSFQSLTRTDLSGGKSPDEWYVCLLPDRNDLEAWRNDESRCFNYQDPSSSWCALADLRMLLLLHYGSAPSLETLFSQACHDGVYEWRDDIGGHGPGWYGAKYHELTKFFKQFEFFEATFKTDLTPEDLVRALEDGWFLVTVVSPRIRFPHETDEPEKKTGHFVLVYGTSTEDGGTNVFWVQNPAGFQSLNSQSGVRITEDRMNQVFSGLAVLVRPRA